MGAKDITKPESLVNVHEDDEGTGIYWFIDSGGQYEQVFVPRIRQTRARELADDFSGVSKQTLDAYRWVPDQVESAQSLVSRPCGGVCQSHIDCVDNACRCIKGRCRRK
jgi:hypothetical protein